MNVRNTQSAITKFPLKLIQKRIFPTCNVLVSEFVPGGSIEDFIDKMEPSVEQWRFICFSIIWTLCVLQDKYRFMHNDCHYGNVLIDDSINPEDNTVLAYKLTLPDTQSCTYFVKNCGIIPKIWDLEFSNVFRGIKLPFNEFSGNGDSMPHDFNPYYDLHLFLTGLLELNIPQKIRDFILDIYPPELIPLNDDDFSNYSGSASSRSSGSSRSGISRSSRNADTSSVDSSSDSEEELVAPGDEKPVNMHTFADVYYNTDEELLSDDEEALKRQVKRKRDEERHKLKQERGGRNLIDRKHSSDCSTCDTDSDSDTDSDTDSDSDSDSDGDSVDSQYSYERKSRRRTEFLDGDRMLNDAHTKFRNLPTPLTVLTHEFFSQYRKMPLQNNGKKPETIIFSYKMDSNITELC